jgi:hypothetical protein
VGAGALTGMACIQFIQETTMHQCLKAFPCCRWRHARGIGPALVAVRPVRHPAITGMGQTFDGKFQRLFEKATAPARQ